MNARFWIWINDAFVKLTLKPGQCLHHQQGARCDEGWWSEHNEYSLDPERPPAGDVQPDRYVFSTHESSGQDCDGVTSYMSRSYCPLRLVASRESTEPPILVPAWEYLDSSQYDQYGEAMGY